MEEIYSAVYILTDLFISTQAEGVPCMFYNEGKNRINIYTAPNVQEEDRPHDVNYWENIKIHTNIRHYDVIYVKVFSHIFSLVSVNMNIQLGFPNQIVVSGWNEWWAVEAEARPATGWTPLAAVSNADASLQQLLYLPVYQWWRWCPE